MAAAVLADIGGGALVAFYGGRTVVIGEGAGHRPGAVIVEIADRVGQRVGAQGAVMVTGLGQGGAKGGGRKQAAGYEKTQSPHHDTPITPTKMGAFLAPSGPHIKAFWL